jgi:hypothetical protein
MDDIRALEEMNDNVLTTDLKLFGTRPGVEYKVASYRGFLAEKLFLAPNAPAGVILDYYAKTAGPVQVTVTDKAGNKIRELNARAEAGVINRVTWDMRYDAPVRPPTGQTGAAGGGRGGRGGGGRGGRGGGGGEPAAETPAGTPPAGEPGAEGAGGGGGGGGGGGRGGLGNRGPLVDAGEYTVTIAAAGKTETQTVTISSADRAKRREAISKLVVMTRDADTGRRKIVAMQIALTNLTDGWKKPDVPPVPDNIKKATDDMMAKVKTVIGTFEAERQQGQLGGAGPALKYVPPPVSQKIGRVLGAIDNYSGPPTSRQLADIEDASAQLQSGLTEVNKLFDEMPKLNKMMADAGVPYFIVGTNNVPPPAGRGGGGN